MAAAEGLSQSSRPSQRVSIPIGWALSGMLTLALLIAGVITAVLFFLIPFKPFKPEALSAATLYGLLKVAFAFAAGIGGVVALVTAYRRQRISEFSHELASRSEERAERADQQQHDMAGRAEDRELTRLFNERFATASGQLGHDSPAIRLAGVYAMAGLADDWSEQRQTCVNVLCAYLRMPFPPEPATNELTAIHQEFLSMREVRHTVIRVIAAHLQPRGLRAVALEGWEGLDFDFRGATFDGGDFSNIAFSEGNMSFAEQRLLKVCLLLPAQLSRVEKSTFLAQTSTAQRWTLPARNSQAGRLTSLMPNSTLAIST